MGSGDTQGGNLDVAENLVLVRPAACAIFNMARNYNNKSMQLFLSTDCRFHRTMGKDGHRFRNQASNRGKDITSPVAMAFCIFHSKVPGLNHKSWGWRQGIYSCCPGGDVAEDAVWHLGFAQRA